MVNDSAMAYNDLREFVSALERAGELKRVSFEVDPYLEITEFADRSVKNGGPALFFEKPKNSKVPLVINLFASRRRMERLTYKISIVTSTRFQVTRCSRRPAAGLFTAKSVCWNR